MIRPMADVEREAIENAISELGCPVKAAKALGISKMTVYRRLAIYAKLPPRADRPPCKQVEDAVELVHLREQLQEWKNRYWALSKIGRAGRDYMLTK